jgi:hypothetical protein
MNNTPILTTTKPNCVGIPTCTECNGTSYKMKKKTKIEGKIEAV